MVKKKINSTDSFFEAEKKRQMKILKQLEPLPPPPLNDDSDDEDKQNAIRKREMNKLFKSINEDKILLSQLDETMTMTDFVLFVKKRLQNSLEKLTVI